MNEIKLKLPLPPSGNKYYRNVNGRMVKSADARDYCKKIQGAVASQNLTPLQGEIVLDVRVYRARKIGDLDNYLKILCDSLQGIAYHNDSQIVGLYADRFDDKNDPRVEICVSLSLRKPHE